MAETSLHGCTRGGSGNSNVPPTAALATECSSLFRRLRHPKVRFRTRRKYVHVGSSRPSMASNGPESNSGIALATIALICRELKKKGSCHHEPSLLSLLAELVHGFDDRLAEFRAAQEGCPFHQALEIIGDSTGLDGAVHTLDDQVGGLVPAHVAQHHLGGENK